MTGGVVGPAGAAACFWSGDDVSLARGVTAVVVHSRSRLRQTAVYINSILHHGDRQSRAPPGQNIALFERPVRGCPLHRRSVGQGYQRRWPLARFRRFLAFQVRNSVLKVAGLSDRPMPYKRGVRGGVCEIQPRTTGRREQSTQTSTDLMGTPLCRRCRRCRKDRRKVSPKPHSAPGFAETVGTGRSCRSRPARRTSPISIWSGGYTTTWWTLVATPQDMSPATSPRMKWAMFGPEADRAAPLGMGRCSNQVWVPRPRDGVLRAFARGTPLAGLSTLCPVRRSCGT